MKGVPLPEYMRPTESGTIQDEIDEGCELRLGPVLLVGAFPARRAPGDQQQPCRKHHPAFHCRQKKLVVREFREGAHASAVLFSIVETAKANGINPYDYLTHVFKTAPNCDFSKNPAMLECLFMHLM